MQAAATCQPWQFSRCHLFPSPLLSSTYHWLRFPTRPPLPLRVCLWLSLYLQKDSIFQCCLTQLLWFHFWVSLSPSPSFFITLISFLSKSSPSLFMYLWVLLNVFTFPLLLLEYWCCNLRNCMHLHFPIISISLLKELGRCVFGFSSFFLQKVAILKPNLAAFLLASDFPTFKIKLFRESFIICQYSMLIPEYVQCRTLFFSLHYCLKCSWME